ncbi:MAG: EscU/YscU/HrcU family type III secretion system export apparatus switch protein, partial [Synergistaceae bacterium]|nr:EscU/YscU/HrcU family type III secretion system export apparatus switch protein [Synergistaceae bacterium]
MMIFNLQFFAEERTEEATPHKREKVREEGRVCVSKDLNAAVGIITALLVIALLGTTIWKILTGLIQFMILYLGDANVQREGWLTLPAWEALKRYFSAWLPLGALVVLFSTCTVIAQVGFAMTSEPFVPKFDRLNP